MIVIVSLACLGCVKTLASFFLNRFGKEKARVVADEASLDEFKGKR